MTLIYLMKQERTLAPREVLLFPEVDFTLLGPDEEDKLSLRMPHHRVNQQLDIPTLYEIFAVGIKPKQGQIMLLLKDGKLMIGAPISCDACRGLSVAGPNPAGPTTTLILSLTLDSCFGGFIEEDFV